MSSSKPKFCLQFSQRFRKVLVIPKEFGKEYLDGRNRRKAVLTSEGRKWVVKISGRHLRDGWPKFVRDLDLSEGDHLVFRYEGNLRFDVTVFYAIDECQREYSAPATEEVALDEEFDEDYARHINKLLAAKTSSTLSSTNGLASEVDVATGETPCTETGSPSWTANQLDNVPPKYMVIETDMGGAGAHGVTPITGQPLSFCPQDASGETVNQANTDVSRGVDVAADGTPFVTLNTGESPGRSVNQSDDKIEVATVMRSLVIDDPVKSEQVEHQELPFIKSSPFWAYFEDVEVFQRMPQKPHFLPLVKSIEASREGFAIGHMMTFSSLVEKVSKLHVDDPRDLLDSYLVALAELETLGFDVKKVVERVNKLLVIKGRRGQLQDKYDHLQEKVKLEEHICAIDLKIRELEEERASEVSKLNDLSVITSQMDASTIDEEIFNAEHDFRNLAAASW